MQLIAFCKEQLLFLSRHGTTICYPSSVIPATGKTGLTELIGCFWGPLFAWSHQKNRCPAVLDEFTLGHAGFFCIDRTGKRTYNHALNSVFAGDL